MNNTITTKKEEILALIISFCTQKLNVEYQEIATNLLNKLSRKKNIPYERGKSEIWAAAIIHSIGTVNFLFDKSQNPHSSVKEINDFFITSSSTVSSKSREIRDLFKMGYFDPEFSTKNMQENNPFNNLTMVNGFIVSK